ncbi:MAG: chromosomal replication initiator protein DnaA [Clostridia bacterium]|nr:chromosomal replication initiator protein DnaA [Clostridia bacterium]
MQIESLGDMWLAVCAECRKEITEIAFNVWFAELHPVKFEDGIFYIGSSSAYKKQIVEANYTNLLRTSLKNIMGFDIDVKIVLEDESGKERLVNIDAPNSSKSSFTFDNFIVGPCNRFTHAVAMSVAENPENSSYNPLVIYGPSGVGKTHLMLAIKNKIAEKFPNYNIVFVTGEDFTNQLIRALHQGGNDFESIEEFRNRYRGADILLVDDIHFIAGKESTQEEFFNTFNVLQRSGKQIVVTLDRPPKSIARLEDRIRNRFESGIITDITPPDFETRVGIINKKAEQLGITISEEVSYEIAKKIVSSARQLEGVVKKLGAYINLENKIPSIAIVNNYIKEVVNDTKSEPIKIERIIEEIAKTYHVSSVDVLSKRKTAQLVLARQVAMYVAKEITDLSYQAIGESFSKDHTTVLHSVKKIEKILKENPYEKETVEDIIHNLKEE